ncbi:hypothetical protein ACE1B6_13105 [Aerosakkonemataceae cyanobacterium BLCC-F154]|uniref:Protein kinase domain-containing protein n=1 Tax=Floridaenema fluviatile BLCC-F154 TaxID=3153640 RepID=A0ABV4YBK3_9CYAN
MLGKILGGRYQIIRHLGGGGFGTTFVAVDRHLPGNPQCVVKIPERGHFIRLNFDVPGLRNLMQKSGINSLKRM